MARTGRRLSLVNVEKAVVGKVQNEATHGVSGILRTNDTNKVVRSPGEAVLFVVNFLWEGVSVVAARTWAKEGKWVHFQQPVKRSTPES